MLGMNMPWMVVVLVATLVVIVASAGVAVTADAVSRRRVHRSPDTAADTESPLRTADAASRVHDWHRLAVPAWMTCVGASACVVAVVGVLIVVG